MKILYDENMPFAQEFLSELIVDGQIPQLTAFNGRALSPELVNDADVLLVRSITQVNETLLRDNDTLKFVGTATIGVDHIDQNFLAHRDIPFKSSPGCNAISVADYVLSALVILTERYGFKLSEKSVGIIGAGNTGSRLSEKLTALGIKHKLCDPILAKVKQHREFVSLDEALACDIISLHVPLTLEGDHKTYHLLDQQRIANLSEQQILINACRGEVVDNQALLRRKQSGSALKLVLDVWENEPAVLKELIQYTEIATAHIAGYSLEGKARGTEMLYQALCQLFNIPAKVRLQEHLPPVVISEINVKQNFDENLLNPLVKMVYDVRRDDEIFRRQINEQGFDHIRKTYPARREFSSVTVSFSNGAQSGGCYGVGFSKPSNKN